jgi:hypothetical protein
MKKYEQNSQGFFSIPREDSQSEILPEDFETRFSDLRAKWELLRGLRKSLKEKCSSILLDYIKGWGWRYHREECQKIYHELNEIENDSVKIMDFFCKKVDLYKNQEGYKEDGGFFRTLLFCRAVIEWEKTHKDTNLFDYYLGQYMKHFGW